MDQPAPLRIKSYWRMPRRRIIPAILLYIILPGLLFWLGLHLVSVADSMSCDDLYRGHGKNQTLTMGMLLFSSGVLAISLSGVEFRMRGMCLLSVSEYGIFMMDWWRPVEWAAIKSARLSRRDKASYLEVLVANRASYLDSKHGDSEWLDVSLDMGNVPQSKIIEAIRRYRPDLVIEGA